MAKTVFYISVKKNYGKKLLLPLRNVAKNKRNIITQIFQRLYNFISSADVFLYNNSAPAGGRRGLAVFSMSIVDHENRLLHSNKSGKKYTYIELNNSLFDRE